MQVFKVLHHLSPRYLKDWFVSTEAYTGRTGRNKHRLYVPQIRSSIGKSSFTIVEHLFGIACLPICVVLTACQILRLSTNNSFVN